MSRPAGRFVCLFAIVCAGVVSAQTPDSASVPQTLAKPMAEAPRRNAFGGIEARRAASARALFVGNVAAQSALTLGRGLAEGGNVGDVPALVLGGAAAGAGFYGAKRLVGEQRTVAGFALAYASASLAENVAEGGHALSHVRLGIGPVDVRVATGIGSRDDGPGVGIEIEPLSVAAAVVLPLRGFRPRPCAAGVCYRGAEPERVVRGGRTFRRLGRTVGRVVRVWPPLSRATEAHEGVHVIQGMQVAAATPRGTLRGILDRPAEAPVALDMRVDWLTPVLGGAVFLLSPYERVWTEREAFTLAGSGASPR